jgi:hypothetical protein
MFNRFCFGALLLAGFAVSLTGCTVSTGLDSITVTPTSNAMVAGGASLQLTATGTYGNASHTNTQNITTEATWTTSSSAIAVVGPCTSGVAGCPTGGLVAGEVSAVGNGTATITASAVGFNGPVSNGVQVTVTGGGTTGTTLSNGLISLTIIPSSITVGELQDTGNFLAIGTFDTAPTVRDVTNTAGTTWLSSFPNSFPVNSNSGGNTGASAGIVTAYGNGLANIIAEVADTATTGTTPSFQYAQATFSCPLVLPCPCTADHGGCVPDNNNCPAPVAGSCYPGSQQSALLSTVTVYNQGLNTTNWEVTAPSASGTPNVIHCGPGWTLNGGTGGSVCVGVYPIGTPMVLTVPASATNFGGWSSNCIANPTNPTAGVVNTCTLTPTTSSETVGAIFN